jgi:hypothetical protein
MTTQPKRSHKRGAFRLSTAPTHGRHRTVRHWHGGALVVAKSVWLVLPKEAGSWSARRWVKIGLFCPVCGFTGNDVAHEMTRQALAGIEARAAAAVAQK